MFLPFLSAAFISMSVSSSLATYHSESKSCIYPFPISVVDQEVPILLFCQEGTNIL